MSISMMPSGANASATAFIIAPGAPMVPASPQPLAPSGLCAQSVVLFSSLTGDRGSLQHMGGDLLGFGDNLIHGLDQRGTANRKRARPIGPHAEGHLASVAVDNVDHVERDTEAIAPPPLPIYDQPPIPSAGYIRPGAISLESGRVRRFGLLNNDRYLCASSLGR
jgi:hypothetical protein